MKKEEKRLGKGLSSIFGEGVENILEEIQQGNIEPNNSRRNLIKISEIRPNPYQPRKDFADDKIQELAQSIKEHGVFTPVLVRKSVKGYELIAGERRLRASKVAGLVEIPAIVMEFSEEEMMEIALLENIQREDLNAIEEANAYNRLIERMGYTQDALAKRIGKSREHVTNIMRLLKLPRSVQQLVVDNKLSMGHVRPLVTLEDEGLAYDIACKVVDEGLSVRAVEKLVKEQFAQTPPTKKKVEVDQKYQYVQDLLQNKLQTQVKVDKKQLTIHYENVNDLNRILEVLGCIEEN